MTENQRITNISELGEFGLIKQLTKNFNLKQQSSVKGIGDDAAIVNYTENKQQVITTDLLVEGIHFDLTYTPLKHLGYKAVMVNISDICAMNAEPRQILVSIALSGKYSLENLEELYSGIKMACDKTNVDLIGGDTSTSLTGLFINITAIGEAKKENICLRSTAKKNDIICVSGNLGSAYAGLQVLEREKKVFENNDLQPDLRGYEYVIQRLLKPEARIDINQLLAKAGVIPTSMIDISDGLSSEIMHICNDSETGCKIFSDKIPIDEQTEMVAEELFIDPLTFALNGGEDYELLFTVSINDYEKIKEIKEISMIGHITHKDDGLNLVTIQGSFIELKAQGWNAFKKESPQSN